MYYDINTSLKVGMPYTIVLGARGIGKTYSSLIECVKNYRGRFLYLRTRDKEIALSCKPLLNPFNRINRDNSWNIVIEKMGDIGAIKDKDNDDEIIGMACALSTFNNVRGVDFGDIDIIIHDEAMLERGTHKAINYSVDTFLNMYETINRNRELQGKIACKYVFLGNSTSIMNPILTGLNLVPVIEKMIKEGTYRYTDRNRGILIDRPNMIEYNSNKKNTALYKLSSGTEFYEHAINNEFAYDSFMNVCGKKNLNEYVPIVAIDDIYIYKHKSNGKYYACRSRATCAQFTTKDTYAYFLRKYGIWIREYYSNGDMEFSEFQIKALLGDILRVSTYK